MNYSTSQKFGKTFLMFLKEASYAQAWIYLIKKIQKKNNNIVKYLNILSNIIYFCDSKLNFHQPLYMLETAVLLNFSLQSVILF